MCVCICVSKQIIIVVVTFVNFSPLGGNLQSFHDLFTLVYLTKHIHSHSPSHTQVHILHIRIHSSQIEILAFSYFSSFLSGTKSQSSVIGGMANKENTIIYYYFFFVFFALVRHNHFATVTLSFEFLQGDPNPGYFQFSSKEERFLLFMEKYCRPRQNRRQRPKNRLHTVTFRYTLNYVSLQKLKI